MLKVRFSRQHTDYTCGPASLKMVFDFFGVHCTEKYLARCAHTNKSGTLHSSLIKLAQKKGFYCYVHNNATLHQVKHFLDQDLPVIVHYQEPSSNEGHYSVVVGYSRHTVFLNDPWNGNHFALPERKFNKRWYSKEWNHRESKWILVLSEKPFELGKQYSPLK